MTGDSVVTLTILTPLPMGGLLAATADLDVINRGRIAFLDGQACAKQRRRAALAGAPARGPRVRVVVLLAIPPQRGRVRVFWKQELIKSMVSYKQSRSFSPRREYPDYASLSLFATPFSLRPSSRRLPPPLLVFCLPSSSYQSSTGGRGSPSAKPLHLSQAGSALPPMIPETARAPSSSSDVVGFATSAVSSAWAYPSWSELFSDMITSCPPLLSRRETAASVRGKTRASAPRRLLCSQWLAAWGQTRSIAQKARRQRCESE